MKIKNKIIGLAVIVLLIFLPFAITGCYGTGIPEITLEKENTEQSIKNTITVAGNGIIKVLPDEIVVDISVVTEKSTTEEAVNENTRIFDEIKSSIEKTNAENLKIETADFNLIPLYNYSIQNAPPKIYAYQASTTIEVRTTDLEKMSEIIANAIESGATNISSIGFDLTDTTKKNVLDDALAAAINDASQKAKTLASSAGLIIDEIYSISESGTVLPEPLKRDMMAADQNIEGGVSAPEILPQEIEILASVNVVYLFTK